MTTTVLEPTLIEGVDTEGEVRCQWCERPATVRALFFCGCSATCCSQCLEGEERFIKSGLGWSWLSCDTCKAEITPAAVSDVIVAVIPL